MTRVCVLLLAIPTVLVKISGAMPQDWALLERGTKALYAGQPELAASAFKEALDRGRSAGLPAESTFRLHIALIRAYLEANDIHHGQQGLIAAREDVERITDPSARKLADAELTSNWGALHLKQGRFEQARSEIVEALGKIEEIADPGTLLPTLLNNLSAAETRLGAYASAILHEQEALERWKSLLPADHPCIMKSYGNLATAQYLMKDLPAAKKSIQTAIASSRRTLGDHSQMLADLLESEAIILKGLGQKGEARSAEKEARRIGVSRNNPAEIFIFNAKDAVVARSGVQVVTK